MKGRKCLWPFAFHCTGMPIQAAADSLRRYITAQCSAPDRTSQPVAASTEEGAATETDGEGDAGEHVRFAGKKSKLEAKKGGGSPWDALAAIGVPAGEIPRFVDPEYSLSASITSYALGLTRAVGPAV
jgi:leucyl-tRNA synthetase